MNLAKKTLRSPTYHYNFWTLWTLKHLISILPIEKTLIKENKDISQFFSLSFKSYFINTIESECH